MIRLRNLLATVVRGSSTLAYPMTLRPFVLAVALSTATVWSTTCAAQTDNGRAAYRSGDFATAFPLVRASAESDDPISTNLLGTMYEHGQGVDKDRAQAAGWYRKSAERNFAPAQFNLGRAYLDGDGVASDLGDAVTWFRRSAEQGFGPAHYTLGVLMFKHRTVGSHAEGYQWLYLSSQRLDATGRRQATDAMAAARRGMAVVELDRAKDMVKAWKPAAASTP